MPKLDKWNGYTIRFYSNDHLPAHVHFVQGGEMVKISLRDLIVIDKGIGTT